MWIDATKGDARIDGGSKSGRVSVSPWLISELIFRVARADRIGEIIITAVGEMNC